MKKAKYFLVAIHTIDIVHFSCKKSSDSKPSTTTVEYRITSSG